MFLPGRHSTSLFCLLAFAAASFSVSGNEPAVRVKVTPGGPEASSGLHRPILALPAEGPVTATLSAEAFGFQPTQFTWTAVPPADVKTQHIRAAKTAPVLRGDSGPQVTVDFPERGIYQLLLTATDNSTTAKSQVWVNVWDRLDGLNPVQQIGTHPGIAPPSAVRQLWPDPGPYSHPRLLFTDADWPELSAKASSSVEVSAALDRLRQALDKNFDSPDGTLRIYAEALSAWADEGFTDSFYRESVETARVFSDRKYPGRDPANHLPDALVVAGYLQWLADDPSAGTVSDPDRIAHLAKVAAAAGRAELTRRRLGIANETVSAPAMAVAYDILYDGMTPAQRNDLRDYLYTIGYGYYNTGGGGIERGARPTPEKYFANGDFPNLSDPVILPALAIEGEERDVSPDVVAMTIPTAPPAEGPGAWTHASPATLWNLYRMMRWYSEFFVTPWGSPLNHHAYFEASAGNSGPAMLALARRGQNGFVTTNLYQASFHVLNNLHPETPGEAPVLWDHHDGMGFGNGIGGYAGRYLARYMYPDDALMDAVYPAFRNEVSIDFYTALFHVDRASRRFADLATEKNLALTHFDPFRGAATTRNSWDEEDLALYFECRPDVQGHMHAEANNFSLYALGRPWSTPPGYHVTINEAAATVLIRDPSLPQESSTGGYIGQSPSAGTITPERNQFPTPPGRFLEVVDDPAGRWTLFAGDARAPYTYAFERDRPSVDTGERMADFFYGDAQEQMLPDYNPATDDRTLKVGNTAYNPVDYAFRTVFTVRGERPYVIVVDDIRAKGGGPRDYRWNLPAFGRGAVETLRMQDGATSTEAILYHEPDGDHGPRLLVRELGCQSPATQPPILHERRLDGDDRLDIGVDNNSKRYTYVRSNRLLITREKVDSPGFKVLLFPHRAGQELPTTSWNADRSVLTIDLRNGFTDRITFDVANPDARTRITAFTRTRTGGKPPELGLPPNITAVASEESRTFNGKPGAVVDFGAPARDEAGTPLKTLFSAPPGTVFPEGVHTVHATATDTLGQVASGQFTVTVSQQNEPISQQ